MSANDPAGTMQRGRHLVVEAFETRGWTVRQGLRPSAFTIAGPWLRLMGLTPAKVNCQPDTWADFLEALRGELGLGGRDTD